MILSAEENKKLIKQFKVETKEKNKTLSIYYGDILRDESDVVVISVYGNENNRGGLYTAFKREMQEADEYKEERSVLIDEKMWTSLSASRKHSQTKLFIHSSALEGELISLEDFRIALKMTFATLNSFIFEGNNVTSIALPVLFRKGIRKDEYANYVHNFVFEASECLRKNSLLEEIKIYIWHEKEAEFWVRTLNDKLTVSLEEEIGNVQETKIRKDILRSLKKPNLKELLPSWLIRKVEKELNSTISNVIPLVNEGSKMIDFITIDLMKIMKLPSEALHMNPYQRIFAIKSSRSTVEWFGEYLYSIKVFKKYAANQSPSTLDIYHFLLQFAQVLDYYEQIKSMED